MGLTFRLATPADLPRIRSIYAAARQFMGDSGNPNQWSNGYPNDAIIQEDLNQEQLYVCTEDGVVLGVFCYFPGPEPDYLEIHQGVWPNDRPYGVVHRIAAGIRGKGIASACLAYAYGKCGNLRIDTHRDNIPMQRTLVKNGFHYCGIIHLSKNGDPRLAYQKTSG